MKTIRITPTSPEHHAAIARYGNRFWPRESRNGQQMMIPVDRDGVPRVAEFVFVRTDAEDKEPT